MFWSAYSAETVHRTITFETLDLQASWALNTSEPIQEGSCVLCGTKAGAVMKNNTVVLNKDDLGKLITTEPDLTVRGVAFYDGVTETPAITEAARWIDAIVNDKELYTKPEQACVVSEILEAIYTSNKTGQPVYFD